MFTLPDPVAKTFKRLGLAPECIASRPDPNDARPDRASVSKFITAVRQFERDPLVRLQLCETSILVRSPTFRDERGFLHELTLLDVKEKKRGNDGETCDVSLSLGWRGLINKTPTLYVSLFDGYTDGFSGKVRASGRLGQAWLGAIMNSEHLTTEVLRSNLEEHVRCARLYHTAAGREFSGTDSFRLAAVDRLITRKGSIAREYVHNLCFCSENDIVLTAVKSFSDEELKDRVLFHHLIDAMLINDGAQSALAAALKSMKVDEGTINYGIQCAEFGSKYTFCDVEEHSERVVACLKNIQMTRGLQPSSDPGGQMAV